MSDSRLERFLYAIAALDVDDLPSPLSRIEVLWNCLITGDTSVVDFTPLSRNEEYLMYILGIYDNLPTPSPLSRGEKLLYKIATGDTDLNDVGQPLSKYEELLQYIVSQGSIGDTDFEYITYILTNEHTTLYNTKELPIESAILKGMTLKNINDYSSIELQNNISVENGLITIEAMSKYTEVFIPLLELKPSTKYLVKYEVVTNTLDYEFNISTPTSPRNDLFGKYTNIPVGFIGTQTTIITSLEDISNIIYTFRSYLSGNATSGIIKYKIMVIEYQEGMENWDIPYFEGIQSVKMPVLTTCNYEKLDTRLDSFIPVSSSEVPEVDFETSTVVFPRASTGYYMDYVFKANETLTFGFEEATGFTNLRLYDLNGFGESNIVVRNLENGESYTPDVDCRFRVWTSEVNATIKGLKFIKGNVNLNEEPYKSNILTTPSELELRGIGDIKDELNLLTGELTERVGGVVLDGSEAWTYSGYSTSDYPAFYVEIKDSKNALSYTNFICDGFVGADVVTNRDMEGVMMNKNDINSSGGSNFLVRISSSKLSTSDVTGFKEYLGSNPLTVYYVLKNEVEGSINITTKDQDGNNTKLKSFDDLTYVTLSSEGLIPEAELKVATKNEEVLNTLSLEMDDISTTQTTLEETSDIQSENIDSTMIATTEIYEGLL